MKENKETNLKISCQDQGKQGFIDKVTPNYSRPRSLVKYLELDLVVTTVDFLIKDEMIKVVIKENHSSNNTKDRFKSQET